MLERNSEEEKCMSKRLVQFSRKGDCYKGFCTTERRIYYPENHVKVFQRGVIGSAVIAGCRRGVVGPRFMPNASNVRARHVTSTNGGFRGGCSVKFVAESSLVGADL